MGEQELKERMARIEALALAALTNRMEMVSLIKIIKVARGQD
jgi:hypothetical protein